MLIKILATGSKGNCYHVSDGVTELLIECGIRYTEIIRGLDYSVGNIGAVLVSHAHKDHSLCAAEMAEMGFEMLMPEMTAIALGLEFHPCVALAVQSKQYNVGTFGIVPFPLVHCNSDGSPCVNFGYLIASSATREKLLFATDIKNIRTMIIEWCDNSFYMRELFRNYHLDKEMGVITETVYDHRGDRKQGVCKSNSTYFVEVVGNVHDNPELLNKEVAQNGG